ncbi:hypothetical protein [Ethanoligenens harbinense]|uniref:Uncharacterized protein n=1 Tax=Ethanoligenens harbinense (strain DSM 18485 / JCM 12961 / CGMCC 1.5033 / YUAN-3) TaxID=663278 RepID=E6U441_ETHHY|nr:hypothetical protein [Ethanoligenens harbinense]ADU26541.1 hypothetical protein Ethha_0988 [Ethanoligenens harbinense YUAN-3]AVQ95667.1 hypothetical protein CXQ68_05120 [Ethanoligenens harbinense YUAN-3]AYF38330.1 hypothetical protein CXP51_04980 [Ethanoligenens harbinense]AYF41075.1 hypothetical protein CN246_05110 [Ethanoligenens harbinense]QCN91906.1 hypothetical protein DRA42_05135 [Ethanoligenens harbinense]
MPPHTVHRTLRRILTVLFVFLLPFTLTACGPMAKTGSDSPNIISRHVSVSSGNGREASQKVTITLTFDRAICVNQDVNRQLSVTLNGKAPDSKTMQCTVAADKSDNRRLIFTLSALSGDTDPTKGAYFAVYEGNLVIAAKSGASVPAVTDLKGKYAAKWPNIHVQIPSGVALTQVAAVKGSATASAQTAVRVTSIGVIRAMTWVQFLENGQPVMQKGYKKGGFSYINDGSFPVHDHELFQMDAEDYAKEIAESLESYFGKGTPTAGRFIFSSSKDTVTIRANTQTDGQTLSLQIFNHMDD